MSCPSCGEPLGGLAFPGAKIRCAKCGEESVVGEAATAVPAAVYRAPAAPTRESIEDASSRSAPDRRCPRCGVALGAPVDGRSTCARCDGDFVDHAGVGQRLASADAQRSTEAFRRRQKFDPDVRSFPCPVCREQMQRSAFGATSGIYLDACERHGIWFDARELDDAMAYVSAVGLDVAKAPLPGVKVEATAPRAASASPRSAGASDPAVLKAGLDASLGYDLARDEAAVRGARRDARASVNLIGFVLRLFG